MLGLMVHLFISPGSRQLQHARVSPYYYAVQLQSQPSLSEKRLEFIR